MSNCSVVFIETGLKINIPDLKERSASIFPFWGNYTFIDFHMSQLDFSDVDRKMLILERKYFDSVPKIRTKLYNSSMEIIRLENSIEEFIEILESLETDNIIITSTSYIALFDTPKIKGLMENPVKNIIKISIDNTPVDLFLVNKKYFIDILSRSISHSRWKDDFSSYLFDETLHSNFDSIIDIPGYFIFSNNLMQLYKTHLWLIRNLKNENILNTFRKLHHIELENPNSTITKHGNVINSLICAGVEVSGHVENSIIFPGVKIKRNARVIDSVIMSNNRIGSQSVIINSLILPFDREFMKNINTIEDKTEIGSNKSSQIKNSKFPEQITDGLTVIGIDTIIGREIRIEPGSYVIGNINFKTLEKEKKIAKGSFFSNRE